MMISLLLGLYAANPALTQAHVRLVQAQTQFEQTITQLADRCQSDFDLMDLGKEVYSLDRNSARGVFERIPDHIDEGGFVDISHLYQPLIDMGFSDIAKQISDINKKGTGK